MRVKATLATPLSGVLCQGNTKKVISTRMCCYGVCHCIFRANFSTRAMPSTPEFEPLTPPLTSKRPGVCKLLTRVNALIERDKWRQVLLFARPEWVPLVKRQGLTPVAPLQPWNDFQQFAESFQQTQ